MAEDRLQHADVYAAGHCKRGHGVAQAVRRDRRQIGAPDHCTVGVIEARWRIRIATLVGDYVPIWCLGDGQQRQQCGRDRHIAATGCGLGCGVDRASMAHRHALIVDVQHHGGQVYIRPHQAAYLPAAEAA